MNDTTKNAPALPTRGPWVVVRPRPSDKHVYIRQHFSHGSAEVACINSQSREVNEANATAIVRAVNGYADAVMALTMAESAITALTQLVILAGWGSRDELSKAAMNGGKQALEAVIKARGGNPLPDDPLRDELVAALSGLLSRYSIGKRSDDLRDDPWVLKARAAIAKATGGAA